MDNKQFFTLALSQHLSSLVSGFEGHYYYVEKFYSKEPSIFVMCIEDLDFQSSEYSRHYKEICPAWQVEDVLRNLHKILYCIVLGSEEKNKIGQKITYLLLLYEDVNTAYQKIEEYLWTIIK